MTALWVLDTDHLSLLQKEHLLIKERINQINSANVAVTVITLEEQMKGWLSIINRYNAQPSQSGKLIMAYKGLRDGIKYFNKVRLIDFDQLADDSYQELIRQRIRNLMICRMGRASAKPNIPPKPQPKRLLASAELQTHELQDLAEKIADILTTLIWLHDR